MSGGGHETEREVGTTEKTLATGSEMGRKFSSGAFICSSNEMRMHYTWIAGDINFLPWTCSGPRAAGWQQGRVPGRGRVAGVVERRGWVAIHPVYNIQHDRGLRDVSAHHRSGRGGGKVEGRVAIPRAVSCSHVQPRASFCRVFSTYFRESGDFDEWNGGMYRRGDDRKKKKKPRGR